MEIKPILKIGDTPFTSDEQQVIDTAASHLEIAWQSIWEIDTCLVMEGRSSLEAWYSALQLDNLCDYIEA